ncbi:hypothetical protein AZG88_02340 [Rhodococcus sp. LB1]|nr:hypothetical protein AZG88_02340 [Rhodococcus sp. LB1]
MLDRTETDDLMLSCRMSTANRASNLARLVSVLLGPDTVPGNHWRIAWLCQLDLVLAHFP